MTTTPTTIGDRFVQSDEYAALKRKIEARDRQVRQARRQRVAVGAVLLVAVASLFMAGRASARVDAAFLRHHATSVHVREYRIGGHHVKVVSWRPGNRYIRALVDYSQHRHTVPLWAHARSSTSRAVAGMNGGTWHWSTGRPIGTVWAQGRRITRTSAHPAVGFLSRGRVVFGARAARRRGSVNILAGEATLIRHGRILKRYPWAHGVQVACGARGTDGAIGCFRSNVVRFKGGRVGLVEISYASMHTAALILRSLHAVAAVTYDSGGSANLWTSIGHGACSDARVRGRCMGIAHAAGLRWERQVPTAFTIMVRRYPR